MKIPKKKLTLLVCSVSQERLSEFIKINKNTLKNVHTLYVVGFKENGNSLPFSHDIIYLPHTSLSQKRNFAISQIQSKYVAMTDDDCYFSEGWLDEVKTLMHLGYMCVFGNVLPYMENQKRNMECIITIITEKTKWIDKTNFFDHSLQIGFSNNCLIQKKMLPRVPFKEWLGPGTELHSGEDADLILSILSNNQRILSSKELVVFHNAWSLKYERKKRIHLYLLGGLTAYYYHFLRGDYFARLYIKTEVLIIFSAVLLTFKRIIMKRNQMKSRIQCLWDNLVLLFAPPVLSITSPLFFSTKKFIERSIRINTH